jgi:hypothetical protein
MVVGEHGGDPSRLDLEVSARDTRVVRCRGSSVIDVERISYLVAAAINSVHRPGGWDELHRTHGAVIDQVAVQAPMIGVANDLSAIAVQLNADDVRRRQAAGQQYGAGEPPVIGLDSANSSKQGPTDPAAGVSRCLTAFGTAVGGQRNARNLIGS